jgi:hypothetical protein
MLYQWRKHSNLIQEHDKLLLASGKNIEGMSGRYIGYHDTKPMKTAGNFEAMLRQNI